jgi:DNA-binding MarR family transcriptional regulator
VSRATDPIAHPVEVSCLCTNLRMATRAITRRYDRALAEFGVRTTQYSILARLVLDGPDTVSHLAARLVLDRTSLGRELRTLERHGLIRVEAGQDRRERCACATTEGERRFRAAQPAHRAVQGELLDELGDERLPDLVRELRALALRSYPRE